MFGIDDAILGLGIGAISGAIGGGANIISQNSANATNIELQQKANEFSAAEAQKNRDFQEKMSNSAYQRATQDMEKAGINPMLAFSQGGASSPSGATASGGAARVESTRVGDALTKTVSSAGDMARLKKELEQKDADIALSHAAKVAKDKEALASNNAAWKMEQDRLKSAVETKALEARLPAIKSESELSKKQADVDKTMLHYDNIAKRASQIVGAAASAKDLARPLKVPQFPKNPNVYQNRKGEKLDVRTGEYLD